jgi:hypothetical protein
MHDKKQNRFLANLLPTIFLLIVLLLVIMLSIGQYATAQYDVSYCQGKRDEMTSRWEGWATGWSTATSDPSGKIRADGKQLASEIGLTLVNCDSYLDDHDKLTLMQIQEVIDASIDNNINYGPPCDPNCQPGPPIS